MDDYGVIYDGPSAATLILAGALILLLFGLLAAWLNQQPKPASAPAPPPPPPAPAPPPQKAPAPPPGVSPKVEQWLATMKIQTKTVTEHPYRPHGAFDAIFDPAAEHILSMVRDYEARVQEYAERCRKIIEK